MKGRLPIVLSIAAVLVAVAGITPLGEAARDALPRARYALNSDKVDGIHASRSPKAGRLLALGKNRKFPASVITAPAGFSGLEVPTGASALDSSTPKAVVVNCPLGKKVIGGGARVTGAGASEVSVTEGYPSSATQWTTRAIEVNATGGSWTLTAFAFCAVAP